MQKQLFSAARFHTRAQRSEIQAKLISAAGMLFSIHGLDETPNVYITHEAGCKPDAIRRYFGNREQLYEAVLREGSERLVSVTELERIRHSIYRPEDKVRALVDLLIYNCLHQDCPWFLTVLLRELTHPSFLVQRMFLTTFQPKLRLLREILGEACGLDPKDDTLFVGIIQVIAPTLLMHFHRIDPDNIAYQTIPDDEDAFREYFSAFLIGGLKALAQKSGSTPILCG